MHKFLRRNRLTVTLLGVGLLALGLAVLLNPIGAMEDGVSMVGWILVIVGALTLLAAVLQQGLPPRHGWGDVAVAVLEIVPGIALVAAPGAFVDTIWGILGVYVLVSGVHTLLGARSVGSRICGVFVCVLGVMVVAASVHGSVLGMLVACLALIVDGVIQLVLGLRMGRQGPKISAR